MLRAVKDGRLPLEQAINLQSLNVQRIWRISPLPKTYTLVDTDHSFIIERGQPAHPMRLVAL